MLGLLCVKNVRMCSVLYVLLTVSHLLMVIWGYEQKSISAIWLKCNDLFIGSRMLDCLELNNERLVYSYILGSSYV